MRLADKTAIVTGAGSGIGRCIAETFARESALAVRCDVVRKEDIGAAIQTALAGFGRLDILVNNAGIAHVNKPVIDIAEAEFDRVFAVNVKGLFLFSQAMVPVFRRQGGGVMINIGSTAAW